jgi:hypothetical protein
MADKKQSFGINTGLVAGAGLVARSEGVGKLAGAQALQEVGAFLAEGIGDVVQARNREFNTLLAKQLNKPGLDEDQIDALEKRLQKQRFRYVYLNDRRLRQKEEQNIQKVADEVTNVVNSNNTIAKTAQNVFKENPESIGSSDRVVIDKAINGPTIKNENGDEVVIIQTDDIKDEQGKVVVPYMRSFNIDFDTGITDKFLQSYYDKFLDPNAIFNNLGPYKKGDDVDKTIEEDGRRKYKETGVINIDNIAEDQNGLATGLEFVTKNDLINIIESKGVDEATLAKYRANIDQQINNAKNIKPGERIDFRYEIEFDKQKTFVADGNAISIATNDIIANRNFKKDLIRGLQSGTYEQLGINLTDEQIKELDKNGGKVTEEDSIKMAEELIYNPKYRELFENTLSGFLTDITTQLYYSSVDPTVLATLEVQPQFMTEEQAEISRAMVEAQKLAAQQKQNDKNTYNPGRGLSFLTK